MVPKGKLPFGVGSRKPRMTDVGRFPSSTTGRRIWAPQAHSGELKAEEPFLSHSLPSVLNLLGLEPGQDNIYRLPQ